jgi:hypothetical protein
VLVGGSAAAYYARHRDSYDHDHVLTDLGERFDVIEDALAREPDWVLNRHTAGRIILGELGGIETGLRQLIRARPLETCTVELPFGQTVTVPTVAEIERIKAYLIVKRNQVRDYLDVAALASARGPGECAVALAQIDEFYHDDTRPLGDTPVRDQLVRQLAQPRPRDTRTIATLAAYKGLGPEWREWSNVLRTCADLARRIAREAAGDTHI